MKGRSETLKEHIKGRRREYLIGYLEVQGKVEILCFGCIVSVMC